MTFVLWKGDAVIVKPFPQLSIDVSRPLSLGAMKTPLRSRDVNIKPIYSVGVTNGAVLRNEVQYQKGVFYWVLKLIQDFFGFAEKSPLKKSSAKLKAIAAWWFTFLHAFLILNTYWFWEILIECHKEPGLHWLSFTSLCDWSRKLTSRPIRYKTKPIRDYITPFFPAFEKVCLEGSASHCFFFFAFRRNCPICRHPLYGQLQQ